jgi:hypothetical protein
MRDSAISARRLSSGACATGSNVSRSASALRLRFTPDFFRPAINRE